MMQKTIAVCVPLALGIVAISLLLHQETTIDASYNANMDVENPHSPAPPSRGDSAEQTEDAESSVLARHSYPLHTNITATVFWVGEPVGGGSSENNAVSAWDDRWLGHFGGYDNPYDRTGYNPAGFIPKENPFYFDLPYNDFMDEGERKPDAALRVPWAGEKRWSLRESMLKNRWAKITKGGAICYAQWEDAGPYEYDDWQYVFGSEDERPRNKRANGAGMDVSPAVRDCLRFEGANNDMNKVSWQFVEYAEVPEGPWREIITTSGIFWE